MIVDGITLPDVPNWLPNVDRLNDVGTDLLAVVTAALKQQETFGADVQAERYERRYVGHGTRVAVPTSKANQLVVLLARVFTGRAGEEQFQFLKGESGRYGFQTAHYTIELSRPWPVRSGPQPIATPDLDTARAKLWRDGQIMWAALLGLALGAVQSPHIRQSDIAIGPLVPRDPGGGVASWVVDAQVQL